MQFHHKYIKKCKISVIMLYFLNISNIFITWRYKLITLSASLTGFKLKASLYNQVIPEDGRKGSKHVTDLLRNNKYLLKKTFVPSVGINIL